MSRHAWERTKERHMYSHVKHGLKALREAALPEGDWYGVMERGGKRQGFLVGTGFVIKTVLGPWYKESKLRGLAVALKGIIGWINEES